MLNKVESASALYFIHRPKKADKTNTNKVFIMIQIMKEKKIRAVTELQVCQISDLRRHRFIYSPMVPQLFCEYQEYEWHLLVITDY